MPKKSNHRCSTIQVVYEKMFSDYFSGDATNKSSSTSSSTMELHSLVNSNQSMPVTEHQPQSQFDFIQKEINPLKHEIEETDGLASMDTEKVERVSETTVSDSCKCKDATMGKPEELTHNPKKMDSLKGGQRIKTTASISSPFTTAKLTKNIEDSDNEGTGG